MPLKYPAKKMGKNHVVIVKGDIEVGDYETFKRVASKLPSGSTLVAFNSDGGAAIDGMNMGLLIRELRFATYVPSDAVCASVCALAWLAGTPRYVTMKSSIGFHAAYKKDSKEVSSVGNALVGAYLMQIGLSYAAIVELTKTNPDDVLWMNGAMAQKLGIKATVVKSKS